MAPTVPPRPQMTHNIKQDYMGVVQADVTPNMRAILVDWLVEVAEEYRLQPETLFICVRRTVRMCAPARLCC